MTDIWIYGASDDLIEVDGDMSMEFAANYPSEDGTMLKIEELGITVTATYDMDGIWRFRVYEYDGINKGPAPVGVHDPDDHPHKDYSEAVRIVTDKELTIEKL